MEKPIPSTIEHEGRLLVLEPHKVAIQSEEGQRYLRERHAAVMQHLDAYPALRKHLFTDKWAAEFQKKWLSDLRTLASFCYPSFYLSVNRCFRSAGYASTNDSQTLSPASRRRRRLKRRSDEARAWYNGACWRFTLMEKPIPSTIEHEGRLLVLEPHKVAIQSEEGQRYLRERHAAVNRALGLQPGAFWRGVDADIAAGRRRTVVPRLIPAIDEQ